MKQLALVLAMLTASGLALAKGNYADNNKTIAHDCAKDPTVAVLGNGNKITVTGACKRIDVAGDDNTLTVASTAAVAVSGNKNRLAIGAVDQINAVGDDNTISWKKGVAGAKAKVASLGSNNTISQQ